MHLKPGGELGFGPEMSAKPQLVQGKLADQLPKTLKPKIAVLEAAGCRCQFLPRRVWLDTLIPWTLSPAYLVDWVMLAKDTTVPEHPPPAPVFVVASRYAGIHPH